MYWIAKYCGNDASVMRRVDDRLLSIPFDEANTDYQEYLAWVAEGNTAEEWTGE